MGNYIAGIFAVPNYKSEDILSLPFTSNDCAAMKELFNTHFGMEDTNINILGNDSTQEVHKLDILKKVRYISRIAESEDTIIFYFSGHGFSDGKIGYLATFETDINFPSDTSISIPRIKEELNNSRAKRKMLIIDSCHSGIGTGKRFSEMSKNFENSLFSDLSEGWVVFASCKSDEQSYFIDDKFMSVFSYYLIEGLKGNADSDGDSIITIEDLSTYVTKNVSSWAIKNNKFQTPNMQMELVGTLKFRINNPEISDPLSKESEISITERSAQSIALASKFFSPRWIDIYDDFDNPTGHYEEVPKGERKEKAIKNKEKFISSLFTILIKYYKPSQIKIKENGEYYMPFGKFVIESKSPFENEFKLTITNDLFTPVIMDLFNSLDTQNQLKWNSVEYTFNGNFDFDTIAEIIEEKEYFIKEYQLNQDQSYLIVSPKMKGLTKWTINFINLPQEARLAISNENGLARKFFQTIPIAELIGIFSSSFKSFDF